MVTGRTSPHRRSYPLRYSGTEVSGPGETDPVRLPDGPVGVASIRPCMESVQVRTLPYVSPSVEPVVSQVKTTLE